jgi:hypothetical protein
MFRPAKRFSLSASMLRNELNICLVMAGLVPAIHVFDDV